MFAQKRQHGQGWLASAAILVGLAAFLWLGLPLAMGKSTAAGQENLAESLRRAAVQCYALEGCYPPDLDYLAANYGVSPDLKRYAVYYTYIGANLMPDITVLQR